MHLYISHINLNFEMKGQNAVIKSQNFAIKVKILSLEVKLRDKKGNFEMEFKIISLSQNFEIVEETASESSD